MPTQKIDPKVIFASDAPAIDKPPVFSDKTKGWDVARANDGRPEIKQMNKMQQDTDLKILWLNENAVLPYDLSIDYPDGAVTLKDGSFKQLSSGSWVEFLDDFADKDAVKRGIANRYDSSLTYNSGERVVLTNGDIVKSTIDGNTTDPNVDTSGWVKINDASQVFQSNGLSQESRNSQDPTILDFFTKLELDSFKLDPTLDLTEIIRRAFATGVKKLNFLDLQMHITISSTVDDPLAVFADGDIELYGNGAAFIDNSVYSTVASFNPLFILDGGVKSFKSNVAHIGLQIPNMTTQIGYRGATYVYSKGANKNITLNAYLENTRYGILAGNYSDPLLGGARHIRGSLDCKNVGYPIATYLADDIEIEITGEGFHRVSYIAGARHARVYAQTKNYYIAQCACLFTDAKTGEGTSRGCSDAKVYIVDAGSTQYVNNGYLCGISLSRVDNGTVYEDIELNATLKSSDTVASKLGHTIINSSVKSIIPQYTVNWNNGISLNRIKISGLIDRSAQTITEHDFGEVYMLTEDGATNFAQVSQIDVSDLEYRAGTGAKPRSFYMLNRGLKDKAFFNNVNFPENVPFLYGSNNTSMTYFDKSKIRGLSTGATDQLPNTKCTFSSCDIYGGTSYIATANKTFLNTPIGSISQSNISTVSTDLTLNGASAQWSAAIPINSVVLGVRVKLLSDIAGATGFTVGDSTTPAKFFNSNATITGTSLGVSNMPAATVPYSVDGTKNIVVTSKTSNFTSGSIRIIVDYINMPAI